MATQTGIQQYANATQVPNNGQKVLAEDLEVVAKSAADNTHSLLAMLTGLPVPGGMYKPPSAPNYYNSGVTLYSLRVLPLHTAAIEGAADVAGLLQVGPTGAPALALNVRNNATFQANVSAASYTQSASTLVWRRLGGAVLISEPLWSFSASSASYENAVGGTTYPGEYALIPLELPLGSEIRGVRATVAVPTATSLNARVELDLVSRATGSALTVERGPYQDDAPNLAGYQQVHEIDWDLAGSPLTIDSGQRTYWLRIRTDNYNPVQRTVLYPSLRVLLSASTLRPGGF